MLKRSSREEVRSSREEKSYTRELQEGKTEILFPITFGLGEQRYQ